MATLQTMVIIPDLADVTLETWYTFLSTMFPGDIGPHVGPTTASIVSSWPAFTDTARDKARKCLDFIIFNAGPHLGKHLDEVADLAALPELHHTHESIAALRKAWTPKDKLQRILDRSSSDNLTVALQSLGELKHFMLAEESYIRALCSGDFFDPIVGQIVVTLFAAACRDG